MNTEIYKKEYFYEKTKDENSFINFTTTYDN
jgi:hypothetical protein